MRARRGRPPAASSADGVEAVADRVAEELRPRPLGAHVRRRRRPSAVRHGPAPLRRATCRATANDDELRLEERREQHQQPERHRRAARRCRSAIALREPPEDGEHERDAQEQPGAAAPRERSRRGRAPPATARRPTQPSTNHGHVDARVERERERGRRRPPRARPARVRSARGAQGRGAGAALPRPARPSIRIGQAGRRQLGRHDAVLGQRPPDSPLRVDELVVGMEHQDRPAAARRRRSSG